MHQVRVAPGWNTALPIERPQYPFSCLWAKRRTGDLDPIGVDVDAEQRTRLEVVALAPGPGIELVGGRQASRRRGASDHLEPAFEVGSDLLSRGARELPASELDVVLLHAGRNGLVRAGGPMGLPRQRAGNPEREQQQRDDRRQASECAR